VLKRPWIVLSVNTLEVVITDIMLPGMDGLELTDRIKRDHEIDVIVMTGYSTEYSYEEAISKGASDFVFKPVRFEELLLRLKRVLNERRLNQERVHMLEKLKKLSITDGLTQLFNSRHFYNQLKGEIERFNRYGHKLSLLLLDIDNFKDFNDTYGHLEGDKILVRLGRIIKSCLRKWIPPTVTVAKSSPSSCRERMEKKPGPLPSGFVLPWRPKILPTVKYPIWKLPSVSGDPVSPGRRNFQFCPACRPGHVPIQAGRPQQGLFHP
jgi:hypothetical protein